MQYSAQQTLNLCDAFSGGTLLGFHFCINPQIILACHDQHMIQWLCLEELLKACTSSSGAL